ncbi:putative ATPase [Mesonia hippocampi]|uniref:Putative ATPase n=1 Tax=Mesonia hippocampi TaxID=1628250 RepID=A0A840ELH8_9FLAO|nr:putative ATPase [Mesonia hippocampi]
MKILLIGGPSTGKTSTIKILKEKGYTCFEEVSREVTKKAQEEGITQLFLTQPLLFSEKLLEGRIKQHQEADKSKEPFVFLDRGIPDVSTYLDYKNTSYPNLFTQANKKYRYDKVFVFPIWDEIYLSDNERYESLNEAKEIQKFLLKTYQNLGYNLTEVPKLPIAQRIQFILNQLKH